MHGGARPTCSEYAELCPFLNGLEAARRLKEIVPGLAVLIFTLYESRQVQGESERAGADAVLSKAQGSLELPRLIRSFHARE